MNSDSVYVPADMAGFAFYLKLIIPRKRLSRLCQRRLLSFTERTFTMHPFLRHLLIIAACLLLVLPAAAQDADAAANLLACVDEGAFDPDADYFPVKSAFEDTDSVSVEYFNHYKVVTVENAYDGAEPLVYVLTQCGTPRPDADDVPEGAAFVDVPVSRFVALSTTQLPHLIALDKLDALVGVDSFLYINAPEVRAMIDDGVLVELGFDSSINVEVALDLEPDIVMAYGFNPSTDAFPVLTDAGIFTALNAEWREESPLGRAEWIKYTGLFFNAEAEANAFYEDVRDQYTALIDLAAAVPEDERPVVLWNTFNFGAWMIPGAETYTGALMRDAGGVIALGDQAPQTSLAADLETVYGGALDAPIWIINAFAVPDLAALEAQDARYADFAAFQQGNVWNSDLVVNENGGSDFYERGVTYPHLVLADLVAILHPDLLPDHEFEFFRQVP